MILRLPFPRPTATIPPDSHRVTSMCLEIAGFTHDDCPGDWCRCSCHTRQAADLAARLRTYREQQQAALDAGPLGRRGTTNRLLTEWIDGHPFAIPTTNSPGGELLAGVGGGSPRLPATCPHTDHNAEAPRAACQPMRGATTEGA